MSTTIIIFLTASTLIVVTLAIVSLTILGVMRMRHGNPSQKDRATFDEEARLLQQIHDDLAKMETRIAALETIFARDFEEDRK